MAWFFLLGSKKMKMIRRINCGEKSECWSESRFKSWSQTLPQSLAWDRSVSQVLAWSSLISKSESERDIDSLFKIWVGSSLWINKGLF